MDILCKINEFLIIKLRTCLKMLPMGINFLKMLNKTSLTKILIFDKNNFKI